jgi:hypothetical protein
MRQTGRSREKQRLARCIRQYYSVDAEPGNSPRRVVSRPALVAIRGAENLREGASVKIIVSQSERDFTAKGG